MKKFLRILGEIVLVSAIFVVIGYSLNGCDVHPQGLLESDMGKEHLDIFTNGVFKNVCIGKHEVVTVGVTNVTNFKCNDGRVVRNITNYVLR